MWGETGGCWWQIPDTDMTRVIRHQYHDSSWCVMHVSPTLTPAIRWLPHITSSVTCQHSLHILNWKLGLQLQLDTLHCTTWGSRDSVNLEQNLFPLVCQVVIVCARCELTGWWCQCPGVLWCLQMSLVWLWGHFTASQPPPLTLVTANGWYFGWTLG